MTRRTVALCRLLAAAGLLGFSLGCAADSLSFVTANESLTELPEQMSQYYQRLESADELPVRWVRDDIGLEVRHIAYGIGLLRSGGASEGIPEFLDKMLCRLNSHVCRVTASGASSWSNKKNSRLCIPAVVWTNAVNISRTKEYANKSLAWLERKYGTCSLVGEDNCAGRVNELLKRPDPNGWIEVPVLAQAALKVDGVPITQCEEAADTGDVSEQLSEKGYQYLRDRKQTPQPIGCAVDIDANKALVSQAYLPAGDEQSIKWVHDVLDRGVMLAVQVAADDKVAKEEREEKAATEEQLHALEARFATEVTRSLSTAAAKMDTPLSAPPPPETLTPPFVSEALRDIELGNHPTKENARSYSDVMVLDFPSNLCHPLIRHAIRKDECPEAAVPTSYSVLADSRPQKRHHGTHISALVAGGLGIGVSPHAKIDVLSLIEPGAPDKTVFDYNLEQVVSNAVIGRHRTVHVANLSVDFNLARDSAIYQKLEKAIGGAWDTLFVAAAGDDPGSLDGICEVVPACLQPKDQENIPRDNLMVVGGARKTKEGDWVVHDHSRYGQRVDILAPASNILSAAEDSGALVRLSGTSQATAIVSGVATRLFDKRPPQNSEWFPTQVKNRLKATARILPAFAGKTSSGLLAADSALDTEDQILTYEEVAPVPVLRKVRGQLIGIADSNGNAVDANGKKIDGFFPIVAPQLTDANVSFCRMYRFQRQNNGEVTFFYEPPSQNSLTRWLLMKSYSQGRVQITTKNLVFRTRENPNDDLLVPIRRVVDFIDKFSGARACSGIE